MGDKRYFLRAALLFFLAVTAAGNAFAEKPGGKTARLSPKDYYTEDYLLLKKRIVNRFAESRQAPMTPLDPLPEQGYQGNKTIALTFDACSGRSSSYNKNLIEYLRAEKIPATLFITGIWIDKYPDKFRELGADPLFEIENHGLRHMACSYAGEKRYGVNTVHKIGDMVDEIELGARKIEAATGRRPTFYRPAAAYTDSVCMGVAQALGMEVITFSLLSGDAVPKVPARIIRDNILKRARPGAVVIMHFNRPEWHELEALKEAVPVLRARGYSFARLEDFSISGE
ncbi:MAG TPA: polysaccharide deacetylase family protein [Elusimicrobiales bacterium]|nr:polysaccharide deacetylase family protein [Elusimicrobiales bacterium]